MRSVIIILVFAILHTAFSRGSRFQARIRNGNEADPHEFPWMAMITNLEGIQVCGGTLINSRFVLTAGHCVLGVPSINPPNVIVRLGRHNKTNPFEATAQSHRVRTIIRHPDYKPMFQYDFALLELETAAFINDAVKTICLTKSDAKIDNKKAVIAGWGYITPDGPDSVTLRKGIVSVLPMQICRLIYHSTGNPQTKITDAMFCARNQQTDACNRDSGGPLLVTDELSGQLILAGVVSWGMTCGSLIFPGVYARVSFARNWIDKSIGNTTVC